MDFSAQAIGQSLNCVPTYRSTVYRLVTADVGLLCSFYLSAREARHLHYLSLVVVLVRAYSLRISRK